MPKKQISTGKAFKSLNYVIQWTEENANFIDYVNVMIHQVLRAKLVQKIYKPTKQTKLTDFFQTTN